jgi:hypothetical protein
VLVVYNKSILENYFIPIVIERKMNYQEIKNPTNLPTRLAAKPGAFRQAFIDRGFIKIL